MALTLTIGLSSTGSAAFSQSNSFNLDVDNINNIREQCGLSEVPADTKLSDVLLQFKQNNAFISEGEIIDQIQELCGLDKVPKGISVSDILQIFKPDRPDNPTQVPIGTPISLVFIAAALQFLPSLL